MKIIKTIIILLISFFTVAQQKIQLRDVNFEVPSEFLHVVKENNRIDYDAYYENGKIYADSTRVEKFPQVFYQYYENPGAGVTTSEEVLKSLNDIIAKDFKVDTLVINGTENYSLVKYQVMGNTLFEVKSLGNKGWLNLQYFDSPKNDSQNLSKVLAMIKSIQHSGKYASEYEKRMEASAESSKFPIIIFVLVLAGYIIRRLIKKYFPEEE